MPKQTKPETENGTDRHTAGVRARLVEFAINKPKAVFWIVGLVVLALAAQIPRIVIDTDPENMLPHDQQSRVFHDEMKERFAMHDAIVVGVVNDVHPNAVFNPDTLERIIVLTERIAQIDGVIARDIMSPANVDNITQDGLGAVRFEWLLQQRPESDEAALAVRDDALRIPMLRDTIVSQDGEAAAIYVPIKQKDQSYRIASEIETIIADFDGEDVFHITGLPVAEDTFGVEMFKQMAISAPLAGLVIFLMMWLFFRSPSLITSPMIIAIVTVVSIMGLLIGLGFPVHIMTSMIPIFLMPIAVVDSVHILSEFSDDYPKTMDAAGTIRHVIGNLFTPMLYTSLTSAAGFLSLAFTPIPPVQVFGVFVALGILLAFLLTIIFIPAYVVSLSPARLEKMAASCTGTENRGLLNRSLAWMGQSVGRYGKVYLSMALVVIGISAWGISRININDNPVRWFQEDHRIRVADRVLNEHFAGTYMAHIILEKDAADPEAALVAAAAPILEEAPSDVRAAWQEMLQDARDSGDNVLDEMAIRIDDALFAAADAEIPVWEALLSSVATAQNQTKYFQSPEALAYIENLQRALVDSGYVGKSSSLAEVVKTVHRELREGDQAYYTIPESSNGVAQTLISYQSSHRPHDLWHMVTPTYDAANIWVQLTSGDNQDMARVVDFVEEYVDAHPLPEGVSMGWAGLTYINVVWQEMMVNGMLSSLLSSFVVVLLMMIVLFRSVLFGFLSMIPLSITIAFIYGLIGLVGKDYDMPIAVLSSLTLGLSIDFAIHFLERMRAIHAEHGDWQKTLATMFEEPGRAITRNAVVIAIGFLPLLAAPLVPYNTVGIFMALIMAASSLATMVLLPSLAALLRRWLFPKSENTQASEVLQ